MCISAWQSKIVTLLPTPNAQRPTPNAQRPRSGRAFHIAGWFHAPADLSARRTRRQRIAFGIRWPSVPTPPPIASPECPEMQEWSVQLCRPVAPQAASEFSRRAQKISPAEAGPSQREETPPVQGQFQDIRVGCACYGQLNLAAACDFWDTVLKRAPVLLP